MIKSKRFAAWVAVFIVLSCTTWWLWHRSDNRVSDPGDHAEESVRQQLPPRASSVPSRADETGEAKNSVAQSILQLLNHKPIRFYGIVVDQENRPVPAVQVRATVIYNTGAVGGTAETQTTTDASGYFSVENISGRTLGIGLEKPGYEYGGGMGPFQYSELVNEGERHHPNKQNPVVFHIWKLQGPEPLRNGMKTVRIVSDGTNVIVPLHGKREEATGADLIVKLKYNATRRGPFDWTAAVQVAGGGLMVVPEGFAAMFRAPDGDYSAETRVEMKATSTFWRQGFDQNIYFKTAAGNFGKASLSLGIDRVLPYGVLDVRWWLNPKVGSHVLEPPQREQPRNH